MIKLAVKTKKPQIFQCHVVCWHKNVQERQASENVPDLHGRGGNK